MTIELSETERGSLSRFMERAARTIRIGFAVAACALGLAGRLDASVITVTSKDDASPAPTGSLRWAIDEANADAGPDTIVFDFSAVPLPWDIVVNGDDLSLLDDATSIFGETATTDSCDGDRVTLVMGVVFPPYGFSAEGNNCVIRGLRFVDWDAGIRITGSNNRIGGTEHCANTQSVVITAITPGWGGTGIRISGAGATGNTVVNTRVYGLEGSGIVIEDGASGNTIGGTGTNERNYIHGHGYVGVAVLTQCSDNVVEGNAIGLTDGGLLSGNGTSGVAVFGMGANSNTIRSNVIVGSGEHGVLIEKEALLNRVVQNWIGTNESYVSGMGNAQCGVLVDLAAENTLIQSNMIVSNGDYGVAALAQFTTVEGNAIGTDGTGPLPNRGGIRIETGENEVKDNVIGYNYEWGVLAENENTNVINNRIVQNSIGVRADGMTPMPNAWGGVRIGKGMLATTIGGLTEALANTIRYNGGPGVRIGGDDALGTPPDGCRVLVNRIGDNDGPPIVLMNDGNAMIPAPTISVISASGVVSGETQLSGTPTAVRVFSASPSKGCAFVGEVYVPLGGLTWSLTGSYPLDATIYATNTAFWPVGAGTPPMRTSGSSTDFVSTPTWFASLSGLPYELTWGPSWADFDGDGDSDLLFTGYSPWSAKEGAAGQGAQNVVYRNSGGDLTPVAVGDLEAAGMPNLHAAPGDYDGDGDLDVALSHGTGAPMQLLRNDGGFDFTEDSAALATDFYSNETHWGDSDGDGDMDLLVVMPDSLRLLVNEGGVLGIADINWLISYVTSASFADLDNDRDPDILAFGSTGSTLLRNDGGNTFTESGVMLGAGKDHVVIVDSPAGGFLATSVFVVRPNGNAALYRNLGALQFLASSDPAIQAQGGIESASSGDLDNDGRQDIVLSLQGGRMKVLSGTGALGFFEQSPFPVVGDTSGAVALADVDDDGDLDLFLAASGPGAPSCVFENLQDENPVNSQNEWLQVRLLGSPPNRLGVGARILAIDAAFPSPRTALVGAGASHSVGNSLLAEFGLGPNLALSPGLVDTIRVIWPDGHQRVLHDVPANQRITIDDIDLTGVEPPALDPIAFGAPSVAPNPFRESTEVRFRLAVPGDVTLSIYDVEGRLVRALSRFGLAAGANSVAWDGRDANGASVAGGVYLLRLESSMWSTARRVTLIR